MDETGERTAELPTTTGARLRAAREARGQSLDDIGRQTRVPVRHLVQIEEGRLDGLPAAPYSAGFVKAYARAVDLDPLEMSQRFRAEFAHAAQASPRVAYEPYEPADPTRLPPRLLAIVALVIAVLLAAGYGIWRSGILTGEGGDTRARLAAAGDANPATDGTTPAAPAAAPAAPAGGAVRLTAIQPTWFEITDRATSNRLYTGELAQGQSFDVPPNAADPVIRTGKPEGLQVTVGGRPVAPLGAPAQVVSDVSLKAASLTARATPSAPVTTATAPPPATHSPSRHDKRHTARASNDAGSAGDASNVAASVPSAFQGAVPPADNATTPH